LIATIHLTIATSVAILAAGAAAGFINAIVGSGTLISFPTLVGVGFDRLLANIANTVGLAPGSLSAAYGFREELKGQRSRLVKLVPASALGAVTGALLLLVLPASYFKAIVPFLILIGVALVVVQPRVQKTLRERRATAAGAVSTELGAVEPVEQISPVVWILVTLAGIYGGYFGAGQGVILIGVLGIALPDDLVRINALKNALATVVNGVAAGVFIIRGHVPWGAAGLIAVGSILGAQVGSRIGRRIPAKVLRGIIIVVGTLVAGKMLWEL
jgi:uncharacterized protein